MKETTRIPLHNRNIHLKGFLRHDNLYEIEAELIDTKHYTITNHDRGNIVAGEPIHNMKINIVLDSDMIILGASAITLHGPFNVCKEANKNFSKIIGIQIKTGWKKEILKLIGNINGCTHVRELLTPIATTAFQTIKSYEARTKKQKKENINKKPNLLGTCHAFNPSGKVVKRLWPEYYKK